MTVELVLAPARETLAADLGDAEEWGAYERALREVLGEVLEEAAGGLTVDSLIVNEPLPERFAWLHNGASLDVPTALDLAVGMAAGTGPYCALRTPDGLELVSGWDGAIHLFLPARREIRLSPGQDAVLRLEWRDPPTELPQDAPLITAVADEAFWAAVREAALSAAPRPALLAERWAYGDLGLRWFIVTPDNVQDLARTVRPRSLLSVVAGPDLDPDPAELEDGFTDAVVADLSFRVADRALSRRRAVVPDADGIVRGRWEDETA